MYICISLNSFIELSYISRIPKTVRKIPKPIRKILKPMKKIPKLIGKIPKFININLLLIRTVHFKILDSFILSENKS